MPIAFHNPSNTIDGMLAEIRTEVEVEARRRAFRTRSTSTSRARSSRRRYPGGRSQPSRRCDRGHGRGRDDRAVEAVYQEPEEAAEEPAEVEAAPEESAGEESTGAEANRRPIGLDREAPSPMRNTNKKNEGRTMSDPRPVASRQPCLSGERPPP